METNYNQEHRVTEFGIQVPVDTYSLNFAGAVQHVRTWKGVEGVMLCGDGDIIFNEVPNSPHWLNDCDDEDDYCL